MLKNSILAATSKITTETMARIISSTLNPFFLKQKSVTNEKIIRIAMVRLLVTGVWFHSILHKS